LFKFKEGDERILSNGDFVNTFLKTAQEELDKREISSTLREERLWTCVSGDAGDLYPHQ